MPHVTFPQVLQRHIACPPVDVDGATVRAVLEAACQCYPGVRDYVLEDDGSLRAHMTIFVDGTPVRDRVRLATAVDPDARIDILQALSGG